jgi:hypothetical protein
VLTRIGGDGGGTSCFEDFPGQRQRILIVVDNQDLEAVQFRNSLARCSSPTSARAIASLIAAVGLLSVSLIGERCEMGSSGPLPA